MALQPRPDAEEDRAPDPKEKHDLPQRKLAGGEDDRHVGDREG
jgi:hypothetical protein